MRGKDILQIDATIIAGLLILLALAFSGNSNLLEELEKDESTRTVYSEFTKTPVAWVYGIGFLFCFSAICAVGYAGVEENIEFQKKYPDAIKILHIVPLAFMALGFLMFLYAFAQLGLVLINNG